jgi:hypothetical protein
MMTATRWLAGVVAAVLLMACGADADSPSGSAKPATSGDTSTDAPTTSAAPVGTSTRRLDSIAVLGHSGATGTLSDPDDPLRDAHENSWATGSNPEVQSIYLRLLADHPAMKGHNYNHAINGARVDDLEFEFDNLLVEADPLPDIILIQVVDNDMQCDGTDPDNYRPFAATLDDALTRMSRQIPGVRFYLVSQWASVRSWTAWASGHEGQVGANSGNGRCDVFDSKGRPRPAGMHSLQRIVDAYWRQVEEVCADHPGCFTDGAVQNAFVPTDSDVAQDLNHLSIAGHKKYAALAWQAFPEVIKNAS